ncbi:MAG: NAD(P)/FAD-dependent oxidoreductase [Chitinophagaceae bacterium]
MEKKTIVIIGAGPAGLTAAYELIKTGNYIPVIIEKLDIPGGLCRTVNYRGNRIDIGGHRFFSKSDKVLDWWLKILPLENNASGEIDIAYQNKSKIFTVGSIETDSSTDDVMLLRNRKSRIYFLKKLFPYPISLSFSTLKKLGIGRSFKIVFSYLASKLFPSKPENTLKDFLLNRFGKELYKTFFEDYTRKVWGVDPEKIPAEWGRQRIKGVSAYKIIINALKKKKKNDIYQKDTETSLIEKFLYPKYGPGQLWEKVASEIITNDGVILYNHDVTLVNADNDFIKNISIVNVDTGEIKTINGDFFISTMPVKDLINSLRPAPGNHLIQIANGLEYREFITVGLLVKKLKLKDQDENFIRDNWIYIQEKGVKIGRLQIFNNWSPYMANNPDTVWLGLEYFCNEGDELWSMPENELLKFAEKELIQIGILYDNTVLDGTVIKVEKAYPGYFGTYDKMDELRDYLNGYKNLFLAGRNGMHRYNNQDHSMLTAMEVVNKIIKGDTDKTSIWAINTETDYHEEEKQ